VSRGGGQWGWSQTELEAFKQGVQTGWSAALATYSAGLGPPSEETLERWYRQWKATDTGAPSVR